MVTQNQSVVALNPYSPAAVQLMTVAHYNRLPQSGLKKRSIADNQNVVISTITSMLSFVSISTIAFVAKTWIAIL